MDSERESSRQGVFGTSTNDGENRRQKEMGKKRMGLVDFEKRSNYWKGRRKVFGRK